MELKRLNYKIHGNNLNENYEKILEDILKYLETYNTIDIDLWLLDTNKREE